MFTSTIDALIWVSPVIIGIIISISRPIRPNALYKSKKHWIFRVSGLGWLLFGLLAISVIGIIYNGYLKNSQKIHEERPLLSIQKDPTFLKKIDSSNYLIGLSIENYGRTTAIKVICKVESFSIGQLALFDSLVALESNETEIIPPTKDKPYFLNYRINKNPINNNSFIFFKIYYENEDGSLKDTLRKIYQVPLPTTNQPISEPQMGLFQIIKGVLVQKKDW